MLKLKWVIFISFLIFLRGCEMDEDSKAARELADTASSGTEISTTISGDFYDSCLRKARHLNLNLTFSPQEFDDLVERSSASFNDRVESNPLLNAADNRPSQTIDNTSPRKSFANLRQVRESEYQYIFGDLAMQVNEFNQVISKKYNYETFNSLL